MRFTKMQGVGNDFVVLDGAALAPDTDLPSLAARLCARQFGIGADGLLVVRRTPESGAAFRMRMFNPDGTEDMCGNGLRCVSLWAHRAGWLGRQTEFTVETKDGPRAARLVEAEDQRATVRVGMGVPRLAAADVPICLPAQPLVIDYPLAVADRTFPVTAVNTGSTHTVILGAMPDDATFRHYSPLIETHALFPERTSILWATQTDARRFEVRIWERGAGETWGCGTGACAVGVAAQLHGLVGSEAAVEVASKGGALTIRWPGEGAPVEMTGPAALVFEGEIALAPAG